MLVRCLLPLKVNLLDPGVLFWRPGEEILAAITGPLMLCWRKRAQKLGERTRNHLGAV